MTHQSKRALITAKRELDIIKNTKTSDARELYRTKDEYVFVIELSDNLGIHTFIVKLYVVRVTDQNDAGVEPTHYKLHPFIT